MSNISERPTPIPGRKVPAIDLRQRGEPAVVPLREFDGVWADALEALRAHRVIRIVRRSDHLLIYPNQFAGIARTSAGILRIAPRFPRLLDELRRAFPRDTRNVLGASAASSGSVMGRDLAGAFVQSMMTVAANGLPFAYVRLRQEADSPRGGFDVGTTIRRFATRGIRHRAVTFATSRLADIDLVRVCRLAHDVLSSEGLISASEMPILERLETSFGWESVAPLGSDEALSLIPGLIESHRQRSDVVTLMQIVERIIATNQAEFDIEIAVANSTFRFSDADALWERAVHAAIQALLKPPSPLSVQLHPFRSTSKHLFPDGGPDIDPDVVVFESHAPVVVVDAKDYEATAADPNGVYQVAAYARSLGASRALLVYLSPSDQWHSSFGDNEIRIDAVGIPVANASALSNLQAACRIALGPTLEASRQADA